MEGFIDASVGLAFSLAAFAKYQQSGLLVAAEVPMKYFRFVRSKGRTGIIRIKLEKGAVQWCEVEDREGKHYQVAEEELRRLDEEKGPFAWVFQTLSVTPSFPPQLPQSVLSRPRRLVFKLDMQQLRAYLPRQQDVMLQVFSWIDGQHTPQEISKITKLSLTAVEEALQVLVSLNCIS
jgi:hypothetical protein